MKRLTKPAACSNTCGVVARSSKACSAPKISGISVRIGMPPAAASRSEKRPSSGLAVSPEKPSEPPHFRPTTSADSGRGWRWARDACSTSSSTRAAASVISLPANWADNVRILARAAWGISASSASSWFDSQPSPKISTPAALGLAARPASAARVPARSSPNCEQPCGWEKA